MTITVKFKSKRLPISCVQLDGYEVTYQHFKKWYEIPANLPVCDIPSFRRKCVEEFCRTFSWGGTYIEGELKGVHIYVQSAYTPSNPVVQSLL